MWKRKELATAGSAWSALQGSKPIYQWPVSVLPYLLLYKAKIRFQTLLMMFYSAGLSGRVTEAFNMAGGPVGCR